MCLEKFDSKIPTDQSGSPSLIEGANATHTNKHPQMESSFSIEKMLERGSVRLIRYLKLEPNRVSTYERHAMRPVNKSDAANRINHDHYIRIRGPLETVCKTQFVHDIARYSSSQYLASRCNDTKFDKHKVS
jgi:hypothetical protein